jgi:hypothetical protein
MGRATSVFRLIAYAGSPIALWATGLLLQFAGAGATVLALLTMTLLTAIMVTINTQVRHAEPDGHEGNVPDLV